MTLHYITPRYTILHLHTHAYLPTYLPTYVHTHAHTLTDMHNGSSSRHLTPAAPCLTKGVGPNWVWPQAALENQPPVESHIRGLGLGFRCRVVWGHQI